jgi:hypothetical protein
LGRASIAGALNAQCSVLSAQCSVLLLPMHQYPMRQY